MSAILMIISVASIFTLTSGDWCTGKYPGSTSPEGTKCVKYNNKFCQNKEGPWGKTYCWTTERAPRKWGSECVKCKDICTAPLRYSIINGQVSSKGIPKDMVAIFTCDDGFKLIGEKNVKCKAGKWAGNFPICKALPVDGKWAEWSNWSLCSATCGSGTRKRKRRCIGPRYGGKHLCGPHQEEVEKCSGKTCACQVDSGGDYTGTVSTTKSGFTCERWDTRSGPGWPDHNYCRNDVGNVRGRTALWCFSTNPDKEWELCDVPFCVTVPKCASYYEIGVAYYHNDINLCRRNKKPTAKACQEFCKSTRGCVGWEWGHDGDNCCAKSKMVNKRTGLSGRISGLRNACPPPVWKEWSNWSPCSRTCGSGGQTRRRTCSGGYGECKGFSADGRVCNSNSCPEK